MAFFVDGQLLNHSNFDDLPVVCDIAVRSIAYSLPMETEGDFIHGDNEPLLSFGLDAECEERPMEVHFGTAFSLSFQQLSASFYYRSLTSVPAYVLDHKLRQWHVCSGGCPKNVKIIGLSMLPVYFRRTSKAYIFFLHVHSSRASTAVLSSYFWSTHEFLLEHVLGSHLSNSKNPLPNPCRNFTHKAACRSKLARPVS